ncbi:MAG: tyrosine-type recombinase/integrase [Polyangia bacterium]
MSIRRIRNSWWVDFRVNNTRHRVRSPENSQAGAKAYEAVLRHRLTIGEPAKPASPGATTRTFGDFAKEWFETYVRTNNKPSTQALRWSALTSHLVPAFGDLPLAEIDVTKVEHYKMAELAEGLSAGTINLYVSILAKCLHDAVEWGVLTVAPKTKFLRQPRHRFDFLSHEEADRLVAAIPAGQWQTMATLALNTGLRIGEICGLEWNDVDTNARQLVVRRSVVRGIVGSTKNNRERQIPLSAAAVGALAKMPRDCQFVFHREDGGSLLHATARSQMIKACKRAGLRKIGWHVLRHTFASWLVSDGVPLPVVQSLLGHANIEMTMRYSHMAPSSFRSAIDVLERRCNPTPIEYSWAPGGQRPPIATPTGVNSTTSEAPVSSLDLGKNDTCCRALLSV